MTLRAQCRRRISRNRQARRRCSRKPPDRRAAFLSAMHRQALDSRGARGRAPADCSCVRAFARPHDGPRGVRRAPNPLAGAHLDRLIGIGPWICVTPRRTAWRFSTMSFCSGASRYTELRWRTAP